MIREMWAVKVVWQDGCEHLIRDLFDSRSLARKQAKEWNQMYAALPPNERVCRYLPIRIRVQEVGKG